MRVFEMFIEDDRYTVPTLYIATLGDEIRAREVAERLLGDSNHHQAVEVCEAGAVLFSLGQERPGAEL